MLYEKTLDLEWGHIMKKKIKMARRKFMRHRSPWSRLTKTVNKLTQLANNRKDPGSYLERAEMARLKRSLGKLKEELKESQKTNLDLLHTIDTLEKKLESASSQLARVSDALKDLSTSLGPPGAQ